MIKAKFQVGWDTIECTGETPSDAFMEVNRIQDLSCLVNQAMMFGEAKKGKMLLNQFIIPAQNGELTLEDCKGLFIEFEPGTVSCLEIEEVEDE